MHMTVKHPAALALLAPLTLLTATPAMADTANATAAGDILENLAITEVSTLDFGTIVPSAAAGRIIVRRGRDACISRGGATQVGTDCARGEFLVTGPSRHRIRISPQTGAITLTRQGGSETMTMDRLRINGNRNKRLNGAGRRRFFVSGRLQVGANQEPGIYDANYNVTVDFR